MTNFSMKIGSEILGSPVDIKENITKNNINLKKVRHEKSNPESHKGHPTCVVEIML